MPLTLATVPCLSDNYAYLIHDPAAGRTAVIDVPEAAPVLAALSEHGWSLDEIWITHHHHDHVGGVDTLRNETGARVTGARADDHRLPRLDRAVAPGDSFDFAAAPVEVIEVSGHTVGHVAFHIPAAKMAFTGDSLMGLGCGRLFEGDAAMMWDSLCRLRVLPGDTLICSGHEYSQSNARFALTIEPDNAALAARAAAIDAARAAGEATVPVRLSLELETNPFLRADQPALKDRLGLTGTPDAEVFGEIRRRKDSF
ncbi:hydroxyacylglutathione hydrolase [Mangrovicoccus algicola]|uniref:Hydroxyacylglutathione hydrolase n=1 Tax=Mangrovicoccus algicola TaxID=2771008 RepID=A0A8J6YTI5_9RHOB|nr:hydroxyacylglutathione hydrolase [Mangrovicoccus algicola]MBE3637547.1 hydroxyacylglutathione hydrolase [Mangrovicoccus algicola]